MLASTSSRELTPILRARFLFGMHATKGPKAGVKYKRIILKLSGEVLRGGKNGDPIDAATKTIHATAIKPAA